MYTGMRCIKGIGGMKGFRVIGDIRGISVQVHVRVKLGCAYHNFDFSRFLCFSATQCHAHVANAHVYLHTYIYTYTARSARSTAHLHACS